MCHNFILAMDFCLATFLTGVCFGCRLFGLTVIRFAAGQQYQYIPEAYGQAYSGAEASVTKHLSRRKVQDQVGQVVVGQVG